MKRLIFVAYILLFSISAEAQLIGLTLDNYAHQNSYPNDRRFIDYDQRLLKDEYRDPKKIYDRIDFIKYGDTLYTKGQCYNRASGLSMRVSNGIEILPHGPIYYSNGQVYAHTDINTRVYIDESKDIYHKNGTVRLHGYRHSLSPDVNIVESYNDKGKMVANWYIEAKYPKSTPFVFNNNNVLVENYRRGLVIAPSANFPISKQLSLTYNGTYHQYEGYLTAGTYNMGDKYILTGYFAPSVLINGNGTVLFAEDTETKECWWVLVINNKIEYAIPANIKDKPNVEVLNNIPKEYVSISQIDKPKIKAFRGANKRIVIENPYELLSSQNSYSFNPYEKDVLHTFSIATLETPNFNTHTGYGISMTSEDDIIPGQIRYITVGNMENGKLNGMGYKCKITYLLLDNSGWKHKDKVVVKEIKVEASLGEFKNGVLVKGRTINEIDAKYTKIWDNITIPGLTSKSGLFTRGDFRMMDESKVLYFSTMYTGDRIYIEEVNRVFTIRAIDKVKKEITIESDIPGETTTLNPQSGKIFGILSRNSSTIESCPTTEKQQTFKTVPVDIKTVQRSYIGVSTGVKDGVRYTYPKQPDKMITTTVYEKRVSGEVAVTCKKCNGTGKRTVGNLEKVAFLVDFNR